MNKTLIAAFAGAAWTLFAPAASAQSDEIAALKSRGTLLCGVGANYVPFSFVEDQSTRKVVGYDVDLCEAIAAKIGVKPELKFITTASRIPDLQQGRIDLTFVSLSITPERQELVNFSYPYLINHTTIVTMAGQPLKALSDLDGARVSVPEGGLTGSDVTRTIPNAKTVGFPTPATAFMAMEQGKVRAMAGDEAAILGLVRNAPGKYAVFAQPVSSDKIGIGIRKNEPKLQEVVNQTLLDLEKSGQALVIWDRWFGANSPLKRGRTFKFGPSN